MSTHIYTTVVNMFTDLKENMVKQLNEIRKRIYKQNENINNDKEITKKDQTNSEG